MKYCRVCGEEKSLDNFYKAKGAKDGHRNECKACKTNQLYQWRDKNRKAFNAARRRYSSNNPEKISAQNKKYYKDNKSYVKSSVKRYRKENKDKVAAASRRWQKEHPGYDSNRKHKRRAQMLSNGAFLVLDKEVKRLYSSNCIHCGATENITMDHLIPVSRGGRHSIGNIVPMCQKCNFSKHAKLYAEWRYEDERASKN